MTLVIILIFSVFIGFLAYRQIKNDPEYQKKWQERKERKAKAQAAPAVPEAPVVPGVSREIVKQVLKAVEADPGLTAQALKGKVASAGELTGEQWKDVVSAMRDAGLLKEISLQGQRLLYLSGPNASEQQHAEEYQAQEKSKQRWIAIIAVIVALAFAAFLSTEAGTYFLYIAAMVVAVILLIAWLR